MKVSVGLPVYDGNVSYRLVSCLLTETAIASALGDQLTVRFLPSCTNLAMGRNQIVKDFLESGDERLVFLDADVTFEPGSLIKLAHYTEDFAGGAYPRKNPNREDYPVAFLEDQKELWANKHGLLEVKMVPTGFLSLSRSGLDAFAKHYAGREYPSDTGKTFCYFQIPYRDGALYTEDSYFCREWREMGGKIFLAPEIELTHWNGNIPFVGHIGKWLRKINGLSLSA